MSDEHSESSSSTASDLEGARPEAVEFCILSVKNVYIYTISSFPAIQLRLQDAVVESWPGDEHNTMDMFLRVDNDLPFTDRHYPATAVMTNGCCVPVRTTGIFSHLTPKLAYVFYCR